MASDDPIDTREGARSEAVWSEVLERSRPLLLRVIQQSQRMDVPTRDSWIGRVDARAWPFETSQSARLSALVAVDNLRQVERTLRRELPPTALYSMIRTAIEAASIGLWLLDATDEQLAVSRTLRIRRQNIASDRTMWQTFTQAESAEHDKLLAEATRAHRALKGIDARDFERAVRSTDVIKAVDRVHAEDGDPMFRSVSGLQVWRATSSIAHVNPVSMMQLLERHPDGKLGEPATRTSRLSIVVPFYTTACVRVDSLLSTFRKRSLPRRRGQ